MSHDRGQGEASTPTVVGVALVRRGERFLVRLRPEGTVLAGYWEFPGGKARVGESPADATVRECREELGVEVRLQALRKVLSHGYPHGRVELHFFDAHTSDPDAVVESATGFRWVSKEELARLRFPDANTPVIVDLTREVAATPPGTD